MLSAPRRGTHKAAHAQPSTLPPAMGTAGLLHRHGTLGFLLPSTVSWQPGCPRGKEGGATEIHWGPRGKTQEPRKGGCSRTGVAGRPVRRTPTLHGLRRRGSQGKGVPGEWQVGTGQASPREDVQGTLPSSLMPQTEEATTGCPHLFPPCRGKRRGTGPGLTQSLLGLRSL